jgi:hypothetical protein
MPFDAPLLAPIEPRLSAPHITLEAAAACAGLKRLDMALLERHKSFELQQHRPSWAYRHRTALRLAFGLTMVAGLLGFVGLAAHGFALASSCTIACVLALLVLAQLKRMRGPAHWEERFAPDLAGVHPRVAQSALRLQAEVPDVEFRLGELFQERVLLDPYLLAIRGDERLLLGIWDGATVLLCA